jgi:hypothetical protein
MTEAPPTAERPTDPTAHQHALEGLLRRLAVAPHADRWVLRGGLLTRHYCAPWPRPAADLDLLDLDRFDEERTSLRLLALLSIALQDGCTYDPQRWSTEVIWAETESPGVRFQIPATALGWSGVVQADVAFHDPVEPPPRRLTLGTLQGPVEVLACARETLIAWKLHGLFEKGLGTFRPKDLHDVALLSRGVTLDQGVLMRSVKVAFESRKTPLTWLSRLAVGQMGQGRWSRTKWARFQQNSPERAVPPIDRVVSEVAAAMGSTLGVLSADVP